MVPFSRVLPIPALVAIAPLPVLRYPRYPVVLRLLNTYIIDYGAVR